MKKLLLVSLLVVLGPSAIAQSLVNVANAENLAQVADTTYFAASPGALADVKARLAAHDASLQPALSALAQEADAALKIEPPSVTQKTKVPPSGDKHDYMTIAPYWWPDPKKADGLPYVRHDGKENPEVWADAFDLERLGVMRRNVETLALAYYFTGNEAYAAHAAKFLRVWFLDPETRMNPHQKFAQAIPGLNTGRGFGILQGRSLAQAADAAGLLTGSSAWPEADQKALKSWVETYLSWLLTSQPGKEEAATHNNHGTWYDVQAVELALVLGKVDLARKICEAAPKKRILAQIEPDGRQPEELARTASFSYSCMNLDAFFRLATLAEHAGVDLWHCQLANGSNALSAALDFVLPYALDPAKKWPYQQIKEFKREAVLPLLRQAAAQYAEPKYSKMLTAFPDASAQRFSLFCK